MKVLIVGLVLLVASACGGGSATTPATPAPSLTTEEKARAACPARLYTEDCVGAYLGFIEAGVTDAVVCVWPEYTWTLVDVDPDVPVGEVGCGQDGLGMVTGVVEP